MTTVSLNEPRRKTRAPTARPQPFPVPLVSASGIRISSSTDAWAYQGRMQGKSVTVNNPKHITSLHSMGFFGKCSLSKRQPDFLAGHEMRQTVFPRRRFERRTEWGNDLKRAFEKTCRSKDRDATNLAKKEKTDEEAIVEEKATSRFHPRIVVVDDSDSEDEVIKNPVIEQDPYPVSEFLHLNLVEAFFLMYSLGCLAITDELGRKLNVMSLWEKCNNIEVNFIPRYACYQYFRSKGWVVKPGIKYGADFCIYKQGPPFYHASYCVIVKPVEEENLSPDALFVSKSMSWAQLGGVNRVMEQASKEILLCYVIRPTAVGLPELGNPSSLSKFRIQEILLRRRDSAHQRES